MSRPIVLARRRVEHSEDATIIKSVQATPNTIASYFFIRVLAATPEEVYRLGSFSLTYTLCESSSSFDIIKALIPSYGDVDFDLRHVDPRLWATLAQLYKTTLPSIFSHYYTPLSDMYTPLLQAIPSTPHFSLVTILELPGCIELDDDNIVELKCLHSLTAFEASGTKLTDYGLQKLAKSLAHDDSGEDAVCTRRGPWPLRILRLRDCKGITKAILSIVAKFPLLSVLDLRGTKCSSSATTLRGTGWSLSADDDLYHPTPLRASLAFLSAKEVDGSFFSSRNPYHLCIDTLHHPNSRTSHIRDEPFRRRRVGPLVTSHDHPSNAFTLFPISHTANGTPSETVVGHQPVTELPTLPTSAPQTPLSTSELSIDIAMLQELEEIDHRRAMDILYSKPIPAPRPHLSQVERTYQTQEFSFRRSYNPQSMFYKNPPPWSNLEFAAPKTKSQSPTRPTLEKAAVDMGSKKARGMAEWQSSFMQHATHVRSRVSSTPSKSLQEALNGGNPFRRKEPPATAPQSTVASNYPKHSLPGISATPVSLLCPERGINDKRVLPISSLKVPDLPAEEKKKLAVAAAKEKRRQSIPSSKSSSSNKSRESRSSIPLRGDNSQGDGGGSVKRAKTFDMKGWLTSKPR